MAAENRGGRELLGRGDALVVVLPRSPQGEDERGLGAADAGARETALAALAEAGVKVRDDSGGRLLVVDAHDHDAEELRRTLGDVDADVVPLDATLPEKVRVPDPQDALFARALAIRLSPEYHARKRQMVPGESPEEKELLSAPCLPPEEG